MLRSSVLAIPGTTIFVELTEGSGGDRRIECALDDGRRLPSRLVHLRAEAIVDPLGWVDGLSSWRVTDNGAKRLLAIQIPVDAVGQSLWIEGVRRPTRWLATRDLLFARLGAELEEALAAPASMTGPVPDHAVSLLDGDAAMRWRARALRGELSEPGESRINRDGLGTDGVPGDAPLSDAAMLRAWSGFRADLARHALAQVWETDRLLHAQLMESLAGFVEIDRIRVPAWRSDEDSMLADVLTAPSGERSALVVRDWLAERRSLVPWVVSPARREIGTEAAAIVGLANFGVTSTGARVTGHDDGAMRRVEVGPRATAIIDVPLARASRSGVRILGDSGQEWALPMPVIGVRPPGLRVGELVEDWTMSAWHAGRSVADRSTRCLLFRAGAVHDPSWRLLVECDDIGGTDVDRLLVRIGAATIELSRFGALPPGVARTDRGGSWSVLLDLEVDPSDPVLFGMVREAPDGRRFAWPSAMLPWQDEPPVTLLDLGAWDDG